MVETGAWDKLPTLEEQFSGPLASFFAKRLPKHVDVDDLVQEVFMKLVKRGDTASIENIEGYVFRTAHSVLNDHLRRKQSRSEGKHVPMDDFLAVLGSEITPERVILGQEQLQIMLMALKELPTRTQDIFVMRALEEMRSVEIADKLKISTRSVEKHMAKALNYLSSRLGYSDGR
ncbi:RNA polymerase sigma factor [Qipengyuania qiaonensis]|uniref:Sigma-70 family RNA polymerase sigma factor n=1 Tax=Qipengyuania qiaonensis TaxID=2867240 RepID=A0ABS7J7V7_9SPHN|nr:sigma-70 family RNA polymerase sigma factor [Qipengyuania qiaonensis]MBX7482401.1 sigma-70 family RNA polymerase sigma factor [Qipengyuania qiaonensis]